MSDIVERLSDPGAYVTDWRDSLKMCKDAKDEIERLRAENARLRRALERIIQIDVNTDASWSSLGPCGVVARRALTERKP